MKIPFSLAFQVLLYRGSHVAEKLYEPLVSGLGTHFPNVSIAFQDYSFFRRSHFSEDTVLLGHSFGGYFAVLDALVDQKKTKSHVKGIVLLNSHFNSQHQVWYPSLKQEDVNIPVFTIAGGNDTRLPLAHVLPDLWDKQQKYLYNKSYKIYPDETHFSTLNSTLVLDDIQTFIRSVWSTTPFTTESFEKHYLWKEPSTFLPTPVDYTKSLGVIDALMSMFLKRVFWEWVHHILFMMEKPNVYKNIIFTEYGLHVLVKAMNIEQDQILNICRETLPSSIRHDVVFDVVSLPKNLLGLYVWLLWPLVFHMSWEKDGKTLKCPVLMLPLDDYKCYYKFLHPRPIMLKHVRRPLKRRLFL